MGQVDLVVGLVGVVEGDGEGAEGLVVCRFPDDAVLLGFRAPGQVGGRRALGFSLQPPQVAEDAVVASFPSECLCGGVCGGEVAGEPCGLSEAAAGGGGEAAVAVGDLLVSAA
ncbi:hypothetical protein ACFY2H_40680 [Streptomyces griseofuscus]|uniref:hypothetical protein n=1 Tax=Streptomyces griseofuscus TaxID=146922 RepID=UPI003691865C